jgi:RNA-directed DNA polymerase
VHGHGKSDSAIVVKKHANKAGQPVAERVERRAEAKGNADQQSTRRAQDRISVSHALELIRQAARTRKKEQFTALLHHVNIDLLRLAYFELKRKAAPGVDGLTWSDYGGGLGVAGLALVHQADDAFGEPGSWCYAEEGDHRVHRRCSEGREPQDT